MRQGDGAEDSLCGQTSRQLHLSVPLSPRSRYSPRFRRQFGHRLRHRMLLFSSHICGRVPATLRNGWRETETNMKRTHRALSAALAVVLASLLCTIPAYAVESDAEPAPPGRVQADETAPNQSPEADHGPGNEVPDASGTAEASGSKSQTRTENATEPTASPLQAENASRSAVAPPAGELRVTLTEGRPGGDGRHRLRGSPRRFRRRAGRRAAAEPFP